MSVSIPSPLSDYAVLAASAVTNVPTTIVINGNTGAPGGSDPGGIIYVGGGSFDGSATATTAQTQLTALVNTIAALPVAQTVSTTLVTSKTFFPGKYNYPNGFTMQAGSSIIFDALGNSNAQFFIRVNGGASENITFTNGLITLTNGAKSCNIFWVSSGNITTGTAGMHVAGNFIAQSNISLISQTVVLGRLYAQTADVALSMNTIDTTCFSDIIVCYAKGTRILTTNGYIPIENIKVGMQVYVKGNILDGDVLTRDVRHLKNQVIDKVIWANSFKINTTDQKSKPICIKAGAFDINTPIRDLYVSPDHLIFNNGRLYRARNLVNNRTIYQVQNCRSIEYFHIELSGHRLIVAEGVMAESYKDIGNKYAFDGETTEIADISKDITVDA